jgi:hypothetical protein
MGRYFATVRPKVSSLISVLYDTLQGQQLGFDITLIHNLEDCYWMDRTGWQNSRESLAISEQRDELGSLHETGERRHAETKPMQPQQIFR